MTQVHDIHSKRYILYYRTERELTDCLKRMRQIRKEARERGAFSSKERAAGYLSVNFPLTHCIVMNKINPNWLEDDWEQIKKFAEGTVSLYPVQLKPGMVYDRPMINDGGCVRFMTAQELFDEGVLEDEPERFGSEQRFRQAEEARLRAVKWARRRHFLRQRNQGLTHNR